MTTYKVFDIQTKQVVATFKSIKSARRKADKLDLAYGCIHYGVAQT